MSRLSRLLAFGVGLSLVLAACHRPSGSAGSKDPYTRLLAHTDRMIAILKDNKEDPDRASRELSRYQEENGAEVERLKRDLGDFMQKEPMKAAAVSSIYGLRSAELATLTEELRARTRAP